MRGSFFGLNLALRGLYAAQKGLDIVNHNLNNVNTPGFSRQQAVQSAAQPMATYDGRGMIGTGVEVLSVNRVRDEYLDYKYWSEAAASGHWAVRKELLGDMEAVFNEPSDSGFTTIMNQFYNALQELSKDPASEAARALVRQTGLTLAKYFNSTAAHLEKLQQDLNYRIRAKVEEVNSLAKSIQELNRQIYMAELTGDVANDLRDQRAVMVDRLSKIVNVEAVEVVVGKLPDGREDKHFVVSIGGKPLVDHFRISRLALTQRAEKLNEEDVNDLYEVTWEDGNYLNIRSGELRAYLDMRDGNDGLDPNPSYNGPLDKSPNFRGIPYYQRKLNEFVVTFARCFNEGYIDINGQDIPGHADGYGIDTGSGSPTGIRFFTILDASGNPVDSAAFAGDYSQLKAKNITVSKDVMENIYNIAASDTDGQEGNIENLRALLGMRHDPHMFAEGAPEDFMKSLIATLGIDSQQATRISANQDSIIKQVENRRMSVSGVSIDEEMANLVKYQHAYNASAMVITAISQIYDTLINRLGI